MTTSNITKKEETGVGFALSPIQRRLWRLHTISSVFCADSAFFLQGSLDLPRFDRSLKELVQRHEILRTRFSLLPGTQIPIQTIDSSSRCLSQTVDLKGRFSSREAALNQVMQECASDRTDESPFRVTVANGLADGALVVFSLPALCADSKTLQILHREFTLLYDGCEPDALGEPVQFADIAQWQNSLLEGEDTQIGRNYWRSLDLSEKLASDIFAGGSFDYRSVPLCLSDSFPRALPRVCDTLAASAADFFLACWQILLWRIEGHDSLVSGVLCDGRKYEELASAPGPFHKYLPFSIQLHSSLTFRELVHIVRKKREEMGGLQEFFDWPEPNHAQPKFGVPYFARTFDATFADIRPGNCIGGIIREDFCCDLFQMKLRLTGSPESPMSEIFYDTAVHTEAEIRCVAENLSTLLESASEFADQEIGDLNLMSGRMWKQLVCEINSTSAEYALDKSVHDLFREQARLRPKAIALRCGDQVLSYESLNWRANQLADFLRRNGIAAEDRVVIFLDHSFDLMVALLGVLKAGAAYVPLDPETPSDRVEWILRDAHPRLMLTNTGLHGKVQAEGVPRLCLDELQESLKSFSAEDPAIGVSPDQLAYVIYTSGSTGHPKGVMISHRGLTNYLLWATMAYSSKSAEGVPVFSSVAFDLTVTSLFVPLLAGDTAILYVGKTNLDLLANTENFTFLKLTPAHLQIVVQALSSKDIKNWSSTLVVGGEALPSELVSSCLKCSPETRIFNEYGPTETVVGCCVQELTQKDVLRGIMPIGRPIANMKMYIVDDKMHPLPVGMIGEIYIGGVGMARGYIGRPDLTAGFFVPDPFGADGERMYKTGDLGRWLSDGVIEFLGRTDYQVKLRGFRIELGEIEAALERLPQIRQSAVIVREDQRGDKRLVAYFVPSSSSESSVGRILETLKRSLPDYMVPSAFVPLKEMPLTRNGKIDRRALPRPDEYNKLVFSEYSSPQGKIEIKIAEIWEEILGAPRVGRDDNFFDLGGHSLWAVRVVAKVAQNLGVQVPVMVLFQGATLREFARTVARYQKTAVYSPLALLRKGGSKQPLYLIESELGLEYKELLGYLPQQRSLYSLQPSVSNLGMAASIEQIAEHYVRDMLHSEHDGPYFLIGHSLGGIVAFEMAQQLTQADKEVALVAVLDMALDMQKVAPNADDAEILAHLFSGQFGTAMEGFRSLSSLAQIEHVAEAARSLGRVPAGLGHDEIVNYVNRWKANQRALARYQPRPYSGRIVLFRAIQKLPQRYSSPDPTMGWGTIAPLNLRMLDVPGDHYTMLSRPHVQQIAESLVRCIDEVSEDS